MRLGKATRLEHEGEHRIGEHKQVTNQSLDRNGGRTRTKKQNKHKGENCDSVSQDQLIQLVIARTTWR